MAGLKYLNGAIFLLKMSVLYPIDKENSLLKKILYYIWAFLYISTFVTTLIQCVVYVWVTPFNLIEEALIIMNIVFYATLFVHFFLFFYNSSSLVNLVKHINDGFVYETDNEMELVTMEQSLKISDRMPPYWTISLILGSLAPTLVVLSTGQMKMPLPAWFPYDYQKSPLFEISFFWQFFCGISLGIIYGATDIIYPCIVVVMGQQFKILASNIQNGFYKALLTVGISKKRVTEFITSSNNDDFWFVVENFDDIFGIIRKEEFQRININYLNKNLKHHLLLLQFCEDINEIMSIFLMVKTGGQMFNVVFIAFSLITAGNETMFLGLCAYIFCAICMLLLYNYSGQIFTENADILWNLYDSSWYLCDLKFQKSLLLIQMKCSQEVCTKAGYYFSLSAPTFITFMKTAFSYIAVLKELSYRDN